VVGADVEAAYVVVHDDENVGRFRGTGLTVAGYRADWERQETQGQRAQRQVAYVHSKIHAPLLLNSAKWTPSADGKICWKRQAWNYDPSRIKNTRLARTELSIPNRRSHFGIVRWPAISPQEETNGNCQ